MFKKLYVKKYCEELRIILCFINLVLSIYIVLKCIGASLYVAGIVVTW